MSFSWPPIGRGALQLRAILHAVTPDEIRQLRSALRCTARELAATLDVQVAEVQAWEAGERFPTKPWIGKLEQLRKRGPEAILRKPGKTTGSKASPMDQLADPELWRLLRKLLAHPRLYADVILLAATYDDPAGTKDQQ